MTNEKAIKIKVVNEWECLCPVCDTDTDITLEDLDCGCITPNYCKECGQALDWSELEGE